MAKYAVVSPNPHFGEDMGLRHSQSYGEYNSHKGEPHLNHVGEGGPEDWLKFYIEFVLCPLHIVPPSLMLNIPASDCTKCTYVTLRVKLLKEVTWNQLFQPDPEPQHFV